MPHKSNATNPFGAPSGGTGKSYLISSVYLWCLVHQKKVLACAPTGIAASNIEVERTGVRAVTIHNAFELDQTLHTKLDMSNMEKAKVKELHRTDVLMIDEISMIVGG